MAWETIAANAALGLGQGLASKPPTTATGMSNPVTDNSGWNVNFGEGTIESSRSQSQRGSFDQYLPYVLAAAGVLVIWRMTRR